MSNRPVLFGRRLRYSLIILVSQMLLIALAIAWGINLILIAQHGHVYSIESNPWILYGEIVATVLIILFAFVVIYFEIVRMRQKRSSDRRKADLGQHESESTVADGTISTDELEDLMKS
jgi:uncharacterized membrane protein YcjF (UPF0283 family)